MSGGLAGFFGLARRGLASRLHASCDLVISAMRW
jgi:hypothetical protein